jgi:hypothetical protein
VGSPLAERVRNVAGKSLLEDFRVLLYEDDELLHRFGSRCLVVRRDDEEPLPLRSVVRLLDPLGL